MKLAYVAGPYRSKTGAGDHFGTWQNILAAEKVAYELWEMGFAVICPHKNSAWFDGVIPGKQFYEGDMEMLARCDLVVMVGGWENSVGATAERKEAVELGIPVFEWLGNESALAEMAS